MAAFVIVSVDSGTAWPKDEAAVPFGGMQVRLVPPQRDESGQLRTYPLAAIEVTSGADQDALIEVARRFLNALAWREQVSIREVAITSGAPLRRGTRVPDNFTTDVFNGAGLPDPTDARARLALAFYREGVSLEHVKIAYSFLSFFKVLNVRFASGPEQKKWINSAIGSLTEFRAVARLKELAATVPDAAEYLYLSGRCAVAHAFNTPLVDPDDINDQRRLSDDLPVIRSLAAQLMITELGIARPA